MGTSTDAILCYGINLDEDKYDELPWNEKTEDWEDVYEDIDDWWEQVNGCDYGVIGDYDLLYEWRKENPMPFELVWHCSYDYTMYILAVPDTVITANRGYPQVVAVPKPVDFKKCLDFRNFCDKYKINMGDGLTWLLCSMWG